MTTKFLLITIYLILGLINVYCFLLQRTARKIRQFAFGTGNNKIENEILPSWYFWLLFVSYLRYIPLVWLMVIDWKFGLSFYLLIGLLRLIVPTNDFGNIQKIKKYFEKKMKTNCASKLDYELYEVILEAEKKTL